MRALIVKKGFPPSRKIRYCCTEFKERNICPSKIEGKPVYTTTGVRWRESRRRWKRRQVEGCNRTKGVLFYHPIIDWSDEQIWDYIFLERLPYCSIYDEGFERIGCTGCPMTSSDNMLREFRRWPGFERMYMLAFEEMLIGRTYDKWKNAKDVFDWYVYGAPKTYEMIEGQLALQDYAYDSEFLYPGDYYEQLDYDRDLLECSDEQERQSFIRSFRV